jgi:hypothetical protein
MAEHPLLIFPTPLRSERLKRLASGGRKVKLPDAEQQALRLAPQFQRLQEAMEKQRLILQSTSLGIQPEQTLVLETVGSVERFINAVKRISGLEWLGELELTDIDPGDGFEDEREPDKKLTGRLFLIMTDQRALAELRSLFDKWRQDPEAPFPKGLAPLKYAFRHLRTIRPWDAQDRIRDTGLWEDWKERIEHGQETIPFEIELWYRSDPDRRQTAKAYLENVVQTLGGEITSQCVIPEIAYHGVLGRIPIKEVSQFLSEVDTLADFRLFQCEDIMYVHPVGQCAIRIPEDMSETQHIGQLVDSVLPRGEPIVALFDGLPLTKHRLLDGRLIVDDPDGFESAYQAKERVHGTAMASLICHGDLNDHELPMERPVYVRPIMQPRCGFDGRFTEEAIPEGILPIDLIHRAVRRLYESDEGEGPVAPSVRVINLSVGDRSRPLDRMMSACARLLDWLSWKYNILFVVSAGNHPRDIELNVPRAGFRNLTAEQREHAVIEALALDTRHRRLLSPAETLNGLTVGASHADASYPAQNRNNLIDPFTRREIPSVFSAHGPGYRRIIKPDILLPGGRQFLQEKLGNTHNNAVLETTSFVSPPGQCVAAPGAQGELDGTWYMRGTSNAAALASRWANRLYEVLEQLRKEFGAQIPSEYDTVLMKTLLVHGADWADIRTLYESCLRKPQNSRTFREYVTRFIGYGFADVTKVIACTDQRVTIVGFGKLEDGQADEFRLPLPPSLSARNVKRRLTITMAWLTPVNSRHHRYRIAHLWFDPKNSVVPDRIDADGRAVQRGTVQHEVLEGEQAADFQDGDVIVIKVNCRADAGDIPESIRYGLAVTLEVAEDIAIYQEVRERLYVRIPVHGGSAP